MTSDTTFNLIDQPWIRVRLLTGAVTDLSIRDVLYRAHEVRDFAGELPSQDIAILRLLEALLLGSVRPDDEERSERENRFLWTEWWTAGAFPRDVLDLYLDAVHGRFDLLDASAPFYQVAGLTTDSGKTSGLSKLIAEVPDGHQYFTTRSGTALEWLSLAEAARWLVHCQAFDPSGIKSGAQGDPRVKGGKGYPFGYPAWAGNLSPAIAEGENLFETLMFNLPVSKSGPADLPLWERDPLTPRVEQPFERPPRGAADSYTWASRRMRLFTNGDRVTDVQISNGDRLPPEDLFTVEPMTAWHVSKNKSTATKKVRMPATQDGTRRIWQGLGPLLLSTPGTESVPAGVVTWLAALRNAGVLPTTRVVNLRTVEVIYGPNNSTYASIVHDRLAAPVVALTDQTLVQAAVSAAGSAQAGVVALANLAGDLDRAAGGEGRARERTFEYAYGLLDLPFRGWIRDLNNPTEAEAAQQRWQATASKIIGRAGWQLLRDAGPAAHIGRPVKQPGREEPQQLDAGRATLRFRIALNKAFPLTQPQAKEATA